MPPRIVTISGSIGAGKTSTLEKLSSIFIEDPHIHIFPEPVDEWDFLQLFYEQPKKYVPFFKMDIISSFHRMTKRVMDIFEEDMDAIIIIERGWIEIQLFLEQNKSNYDK
jgi:deoxyadenosine/deoxycytidine kinase